jgi:predicted small integral membrane protein
VQTLLAKLVKLDLATKVLPHEILDFLADGRLEVVFVNLVKVAYLVVVNLGGAGEEAWNVLFQHGQRGVHVFEYADNRVLRLNDILGPLESTPCVEWSV